jgi:hypothetical protein
MKYTLPKTRYQADNFYEQEIVSDFSAVALSVTKASPLDNDGTRTDLL